MSSPGQWITAGTFLSYTIAIRGTEVHVSAALIDSIANPEFLLRMPDDELGWRIAFHLICALEKTQVKSLARPIEARIAGDPEHSFVIG